MKRTAKITHCITSTGQVATLGTGYFQVDGKMTNYVVSWHTKNSSVVGALARNLRQMEFWRSISTDRMVEYYDRQIEVARALLTAAMATDKSKRTGN